MPRFDTDRRRRRLKRLSLLGAVFVLLIGGLGALYAFQSGRQEVRAQEAIAQARQAYADRQFALVIELLEDPESPSWTLREVQDDPELLYMYVDARRQVPLPNGEHILRLFQPLRQCVRLDPENLKAGRELLELLLMRGMLNDALSVANELAAAHPGDAEVYRYLGQTHLRLGDEDKALESFQAARDIEPLHVRTQAMIAKLMLEGSGETGVFVEDAQRRLDANPGDPRAQLIRAFGYMLDRDTVQAQTLLKQAASHPAPDADFIRVLVEWLDLADLFAESQAYLEREAGPGVETLAGQEALLRDYDSGNYRAVLDRLAGADPRATAPDILAAWVFAQQKIGDAAASHRLIEVMADQEGPIAAAWSVVLPLAVDPETAPGTLIDALYGLLVAAPDDTPGNVRNHPYLNQMLGETYMRVGEPEAALRALGVAAEQRPSWHRPRQLLAELLLDRGQPAQALALAGEAYLRWPTPRTASLRAAAMLAVTDPTNPAAVDRALAQADALLAQVPGEPRTLTQRVALLVRAARTLEARRRLTDALAQDPPLPREALLALAEIAQAPGLEMQDAVYAKLADAYGADPASVTAQARDLADAGRADEGLALIDRATPPEPGLPWRVARASYLTYTDDPDAAGAWIALADEHANNIDLLTLALQAPAAREDHAFVDRAIDRLRVLGGEHSVNWKIERARALMERGPSDNQLREATRLLTQAIGAAPDRTEALVLQARVQVAMGDLNSAEFTARAAMAVDDSSPGVKMIYGQVLHEMRRFNESRGPLLAVAQDARADRRLRLAACALLINQSERRAAIDTLESMWRQGDADTPVLILLAQQHAAVGALEAADRVCQQLLTRPEVDTIDFTAGYYDQTGRPELADQALALLPTVEASQAQRLSVLGRAAARRGQLAKALDLTLQASELEPSQALYWRRAVELALALNSPRQAVDLAKRGLEAAGTDAGLRAVSSSAGLLGLIEEDPTLTPLVLAMLNEPANRDQAATALGLIQRDRQSRATPASTAARLADLAEQSDRFLGLNLLAIQRLLDTGSTRRAADLAAGVMDNFPNNADAAEAATLAGYRLSDWSLVLSAAPAWARRSPADKPQADLLLGTALNAVERYDQAIRVLGPHVEQTGRNPDTSPPLYNEYTRALVRHGRAAEAWAILSPRLAASVTARDIALRRVSGDLPTIADVNQWLAAAETASDPKAVLDQLLLGQGALRAGKRLSDSPLIHQAQRRIETAIALGGNTPTEAYLLHAEAAQATGDLAAAEASYRAAVSAIPDNATLLNNLAMAIAGRGRERLTEAEDLAVKATTLDPRDPNLFDTLAHVRLQRGNLDGAMQAIDRALSLDAANPAWHLTRADILEAMGKTDHANDIRQRFGGVPAE